MIPIERRRISIHSDNPISIEGASIADSNISDDSSNPDLRNLEPNASNVHQAHTMLNAEGQKLDEMLLILFDKNHKQKRNEMIARGLNYEEAYLCWKLKRNNQIKAFPAGFWREKETAKNFFYAGLDSLDGFKTARESNNTEKMYDIYKKEVLNYKAVSYKTNGQTAFYYEVLCLGSFISGKIPYLKKKNSSAEVLKIFLPDLFNAFEPTELEHYYWNDPENTKHHVLRALDTLNGFKEARLARNIKLMAEIFRREVINFKNTTKKYTDRNGQVAFFYEVGHLRGLMTTGTDYLSRTGNVRRLLDLAIEGLVDDNNPIALKTREVEKVLNNPELAKKYILDGLDLIDGFKSARDKKDIKTMADLYRRNVIKYKSKHGSGQIAFFIERCNLRGMICKERGYLEKTSSAYALIKFAIPELVNIKNPNALNPLELQRWEKHIFVLKTLEALDKIPGFLEARLENNFCKMESLFRENVLFYNKNIISNIKKEIAYLYEVADVRDQIEPIIRENKDLDPLDLYRIVLPDFVNYLLQKGFEIAQEYKNLICHIAKGYPHQDQELLMDEGFDVVARASIYFDESKGIKFSSFASKCIKNSFISYLRKKDDAISLFSLDEDKESLSELVSYKDDKTPEEICSEPESTDRLKALIDMALGKLDDREKIVIINRFGFNNTKPKTMEEIAESLNVSVPTISRAQASAMEKIKFYFNGTGVDVESFGLGA